MLKVQEDSKELENEQRSILLTFATKSSSSSIKSLGSCKKGRQDVDPRVGFLSSSIDGASEDDWNRLLKDEWQDFEEKLNVVCQDNTRLEKAAIESRKELKIEHCSTATMMAECMTKPLTDGKFKLFRDRIDLSDQHHRIKQQECVGRKISVSNRHESTESRLTHLKRETSQRRKKLQ